MISGIICSVDMYSMMRSYRAIKPLLDGEDLPIGVFGGGEESPAGFSPRAGEGQGLVIGETN
jgi:hypothetical protein